MSNYRNEKGIIFVLSSPSGAGKSSIARYLVTTFPNIELSISATTRPKREKEQEGVDYHFVSLTEYQKLLKNGEFLEHAQVYDNFYGTPKSFVLEKLNSGIDVLFDIDPQGAKSLAKLADQFPVVKIFILPPSLDVLRNRMFVRGDKEEAINKRIVHAQSDAMHFSEYDYLVINEKFEDTCNLIGSIITAERLKVSNQSSEKVFQSIQW